MKDLLDSLAELSTSSPKAGAGRPRSRLFETSRFGKNPGNLRMLSYVPPKVGTASALVVALHGCTQTASAYDHGSGWSALADAYGFAVLFPEQKAANNRNRCFNWFLESDTRRGYGEAHSIHEMINRMVTQHALDRGRVFIVGLSAGGAMSAAMLASYPDVFAGGAVIAGLPYAAANNMQTAFEAMAGKTSRSDRDLGDLVRRASTHNGPWPRVSVWHGSADAIVNPSNMEQTVGQWRTVHGLQNRPDFEHNLKGHARRVWQRDGEDIIEAIGIAGMGHGVPLARLEGWGNVSPFHIDVGLSSSRHILQFWNFVDATMAGETIEDAQRQAPLQGVVLPPELAGARSESAFGQHDRGAGVSSASSVIAAALARAGLLKSGNTPSPSDPHGIISATLRSVGLLKD